MELIVVLINLYKTCDVIYERFFVNKNCKVTLSDRKKSHHHQFPLSCYHLQLYEKRNSHKIEEVYGKSSFVVAYFFFFCNTIKFFVIQLVLKTTMTMMMTMLRRITRERQSSNDKRNWSFFLLYDRSTRKIFNWSKLNFKLIKKENWKFFKRKSSIDKRNKETKRDKFS